MSLVERTRLGVLVLMFQSFGLGLPGRAALGA